MFWREGRSTQATCCLDRAARSLSLKGLHGSARGYPAPLLVAHGGQLVLVKAEVVAQLMDDGLADLFHDFLAAVEAALVWAFEDGDDVGDVVVVAVGPFHDGQPVEQPEKVVEFVLVVLRLVFAACVFRCCVVFCIAFRRRIRFGGHLRLRQTLVRCPIPRHSPHGRRLALLPIRWPRCSALP